MRRDLPERAERVGVMAPAIVHESQRHLEIPPRSISWRTKIEERRIPNHLPVEI